MDCDPCKLNCCDMHSLFWQTNVNANLRITTVLKTSNELFARYALPSLKISTCLFSACAVCARARSGENRLYGVRGTLYVKESGMEGKPLFLGWNVRSPHCHLSSAGWANHGATGKFNKQEAAIPFFLLLKKVWSGRGV